MSHYWLMFGIFFSICLCLCLCMSQSQQEVFARENDRCDIDRFKLELDAESYEDHRVTNMNYVEVGWAIWAENTVSFNLYGVTREDLGDGDGDGDGEGEGEGKVEERYQNLYSASFKMDRQMIVIPSIHGEILFRLRSLEKKTPKNETTTVLVMLLLTNAPLCNYTFHLRDIPLSHRTERRFNLHLLPNVLRIENDWNVESDIPEKEAKMDFRILKENLVPVWQETNASSGHFDEKVDRVEKYILSYDSSKYLEEEEEMGYTNETYLLNSTGTIWIQSTAHRDFSFIEFAQNLTYRHFYKFVISNVTNYIFWVFESVVHAKNSTEYHFPIQGNIVDLDATEVVKSIELDGLNKGFFDLSSVKKGDNSNFVFNFTNSNPDTLIEIRGRVIMSIPGDFSITWPTVTRYYNEKFIWELFPFTDEMNCYVSSVQPLDVMYKKRSDSGNGKEELDTIYTISVNEGNITNAGLPLSTMRNDNALLEYHCPSGQTNRISLLFQFRINILPNYGDLIVISVCSISLCCLVFICILVELCLTYRRIWSCGLFYPIIRALKLNNVKKNLEYAYYSDHSDEEKDEEEEGETKNDDLI